MPQELVKSVLIHQKESFPLSLEEATCHSVLEYICAIITSYQSPGWPPGSFTSYSHILDIYPSQSPASILSLPTSYFLLYCACFQVLAVDMLAYSGHQSRDPLIDMAIVQSDLDPLSVETPTDNLLAETNSGK